MGNEPGRDPRVDEDDTEDVSPAVLRSVLARIAAEEAARPKRCLVETSPLDESLDGPPPVLLETSQPLWRPVAFFTGLASFSTLLLGILWWMAHGAL